MYRILSFLSHGSAQKLGKNILQQKKLTIVCFLRNLLILAVDMFGYECVLFHNTKNSVFIVEAPRILSFLDNYKMF